MNPIEAITSVLGKYFSFQGRACRSEFWWWWLFNLIIGLVIAGTAIASRDNGILMGYYLVTFLPTLAVTVRRHHDGNRSGWWILLGLIPFIGVLVLFFLYISKGTDGPNIYGPDPLGY
ncbi:MAG: DUF805 domain-containing protein [Kordiimonadaceae bacterium]|nr:DUF805 domain-containing protein [Kordiimonadaceae bacterium]MBT6036622.1 DUF805 domain-containing protein [Kordiimonadaceae bacterium]MBT6328706.1 DUF805 domain-containing protein [Kordiimonadaceae bacterium]MBT7583449.1 DUF805 domain-containing protein [Kordiimonadaceae bacterium]